MFTFSNQDQVIEACRDFGVRKLEVFGSSVRSPESARDVDLLVDFGDQPVKGFSAVFFGFKEKLERLFGKPVDLITADSLGNPYFRRAVESTKQMVYEG